MKDADKFKQALKWLEEKTLEHEKDALKNASQGRYIEAQECKTLATAYDYASRQFKRMIAAPPKMVECGTYGCTKLKPENAVFCSECRADYRDDPDAYK